MATSSERITENVDVLRISSNEVTRAVEEIANGTSVMAENVTERLVTGQKLGDSVTEIYSKLSDAEVVSKEMVQSNHTGIDYMNVLSEYFKRQLIIHKMLKTMLMNWKPILRQLRQLLEPLKVLPIKRTCLH